MNPLGKLLCAAWIPAGLALNCSPVQAQPFDTDNDQDNAILDSEDSTPVPDMLDAESAFQVAKAAAAAGELQTAIVALERVLLINPDLANIKFELGLLYRRVGAPTRARFYLEEAMRDPAMPKTVRERAESELASLSTDAPAARGDVYGLLGLRVQNDSNARFVGDRQQMVVNGEVQVVPDDSLGGSDSSALVNFTGGYRYRFGDNGDFIWNNQIGLGVLRFSEFESEDANLGSFRTELTFPGHTSNSGRLLTYTPFVSVSIYDEFNDIEDDGLDEDTTYSAGLIFRSESAANAVEVTINFSNEDEENSAGIRTSYFLRSSSSLVHTFRLGVSGLDDTEFDPDSYISATLGYSLAKQLGTSALSLPVTFRSGFQASVFDYYKEDNQFAIGTERRDEQYFVSTSLDVPLTANLTAVVGAQYLNSQSNIVNFEFDNVKGFLGLNLRF